MPYALGKKKITEITASIQKNTARMHKRRLLLNKNPLAQAAFYDPIKTAICHGGQDPQCEARGFSSDSFSEKCDTHLPKLPA